MRKRWAIAAGLLAASMIATAQDATPDLPPTSSQPAPVEPVARSGVPNLSDRLSALRPEFPVAYFELAEEVAYELPFKEGQALARTLYVLAFELDRAGGGRTGLSRSACLALADLSTRNAERRWLQAMAAMEPGQSLRSGPPDAGESSGIDDAPFEMAVAIGWYRSEEYRRARDVMTREEAPLVLRRSGVDKDEAEKFVAKLRDRVTRGVACDRCRNERVIRRAGEAGRPTLELCPLCRGNPGPRLDEKDYIETLRMEAALLGCRPASWAGATRLSGGQPLRDAEPDELAASFGVNARATLWRPGTPDPVQPERVWTTGEWYEPPQADAPDVQKRTSVSSS